MAVFFWLKTMMNADKMVKLGRSVWWITYYAAVEVLNNPTSLNRDSKLPDESMTEHT